MLFDTCVQAFGVDVGKLKELDAVLKYLKYLRTSLEPMDFDTHGRGRYLPLLLVFDTTVIYLNVDTQTCFMCDVESFDYPMDFPLGDLSSVIRWAERCAAGYHGKRYFGPSIEFTYFGRMGGISRWFPFGDGVPWETHTTFDPSGVFTPRNALDFIDQFFCRSWRQEDFERLGLGWDPLFARFQIELLRLQKTVPPLQFESGWETLRRMDLVFDIADIVRYFRSRDHPGTMVAVTDQLLLDTKSLEIRGWGESTLFGRLSEQALQRLSRLSWLKGEANECQRRSDAEWIEVFSP
jgi:hypothetical protein